MKDIGKMTCSTALESKCTVMGINIKVCLSKGEGMGKERTIILQDRSIKEVG